MKRNKEIQRRCCREGQPRQAGPQCQVQGMGGGAGVRGRWSAGSALDVEGPLGDGLEGRAWSPGGRGENPGKIGSHGDGEE